MSTKISDLTSATSLTGAEEVPIVQTGTTKKTTVLDLQKPIQDTGWVDMSSYLNTTNFAIRSSTSTFYPRARRIGNVVYWAGQIICTTAISSLNGTVLTGLPEWIKPDGAENRFTRSGLIYQTTRQYNMQIGKNNQNVNFVTVVQNTNIATTSDWQGYDLSTISGYITDTAFPDNL